MVLVREKCLFVAYPFLASLIHVFHTFEHHHSNPDTIRSGVVPTSVSTDIHLKLRGLLLPLWKECYVFSMPS